MLKESVKIIVSKAVGAALEVPICLIAIFSDVASGKNRIPIFPALQVVYVL